MKKQTADELRAALREFMKIRDLTVFGWSKRAGIAEGTLRNFLAGTSESLTHATLASLAAAAGVPIGVLLGEVPLEDADIVPVRIAAEANRFATGLWLPHDERFSLYLPVDLRFPGLPRLGIVMRDDSAAQAFPEGSVVVYIEFEHLKREPRDREYVVVRRSREIEDEEIDPMFADRSEDEYTVRQYLARNEAGRSDAWLVTASTDPRKLLSVPLTDRVRWPSLEHTFAHAIWYRGAHERELIALEGVVVASYRLE